MQLHVCAAPGSQAETLLAHLEHDALLQLLKGATEGDGYVDIRHSPVRYTLNLQQRTETSIERFGLVGELYGIPGRDLAFVVERVQPDPDPTRDAGDVLTIEVSEVVSEGSPYTPEDDWVRRQLTALDEAAQLPLVLAGQAFANHERQWLAWQAEQDARPYEIETEGFICSTCDSLQANGAKCTACGSTNGDRAAGALALLARRVSIKQGDRVTFNAGHGANRGGARPHCAGGGGPWLALPPLPPLPPGHSRPRWVARAGLVRGLGPRRCGCPGLGVRRRHPLHSPAVRLIFPAHE